MASHDCSMCEERPALYMVSHTSTGETTFLCPPCLPMWVVYIYEQAGIPGMVFDFPDEVAAEHPDELAVEPGIGTEAVESFPPTEEEPLTDEEWEASARTPQTADD